MSEEQLAEVKSIFYCDACARTRFNLIIATCTTCGRENSRCPRWWGNEWALCESCAAKNGKCARCESQRLRRKPRVFKPRPL